MINYESRVVVQSIKQYEMLKNSLRITTNKQDIKDICVELNRIEEKILKETNTIYEKEYMKQISEESDFMGDEKNKVTSLINLIEERLKYMSNIQKQHQELTGLIAKIPQTLGADRLDELKTKLSIICKYEKNLKLIDLLTKEVKALDERIETASIKMRTNTKQNEKLEAQMISLMNDNFRKLDLYSLPERNKEINLAYSELEFSLSKASDNLMKAKKTTSQELIKECENMLKAVSEDYNNYKEKKIILKLLEIYDIECQDYDDLLRKREEINNLLRSITGSDLYRAVYNELNKQYNTIKLEQQDIKTYTSLIDDKNKKVKLLKEIEAENRSGQFTSVIKRIIDNENRRKAKEEEERKRQEEELKKYRLIEEQRKKEEMLKRQKQIEEKRKKEIEERTKKLLEEKQKTPVLTPHDISIENRDYTTTKDDISTFNIKNKDVSQLKEEKQPYKEVKIVEPKTEDYSFFDKNIGDDIITNIEDVDEPIFFDVKEEAKPKPTEINTFNVEPENRNNPFNKTTKDDVELPIAKKNNYKENKRTNTIPVIKNNNLIPHKIKEEFVKEEPKAKSVEENISLEDFSIEDIIFPDMP